MGPSTNMMEHHVLALQELVLRTGLCMLMVLLHPSLLRSDVVSAPSEIPGIRDTVGTHIMSQDMIYPYGL